MKLVLAFVLATIMSVPAFAGVQVTTQSSSLGVMQKLRCGPGITCTKTRSDTATLDVGNSALVNAASGAAVALVASQCGSTILGPTGTGAVEIDLPLADSNDGCTFTFITQGTGNYDIDPNDLDQILALTNTVGDKIRNATVGNAVQLRSVGGTGWSAIGISGTWSDAN